MTVKEMENLLELFKDARKLIGRHYRTQQAGEVSKICGVEYIPENGCFAIYSSITGQERVDVRYMAARNLSMFLLNRKGFLEALNTPEYCTLLEDNKESGNESDKTKEDKP